MKCIKKRFGSNYRKDKKSGCWIWSSYLSNDGYGSFCVKGKQYRAHRISWALRYGDVPKNLCVLHKCDVKTCVNPDHLFLGTRKENNQDAVNKGRKSTNHGSKNHFARLTEGEVIRIRRAVGSCTQLAKVFGVSPASISLIKRRLTWTHI